MSAKYSYELIKDYLDGVLDEKNSQQIRDFINEDETARDIARGIVLLKEEFNTEAEIESYLTDRLNSQNEVVIQNPTRSFLWLKVAAATLLVVVSGALLYNFSGKQTTDELFSQALSEPYPMVAIQRTADSEENFHKATDAYQSGDYEKASSLFALSEEEGFLEVTTKFYQGLCYLYTADYRQATLSLSDQKLKDSRFSSQSNWFLALAYYKSGDIEATAILLREIANNKNHFKNEEALDLLNSIE